MNSAFVNEFSYSYWKFIDFEGYDGGLQYGCNDLIRKWWKSFITILCTGFNKTFKSHCIILWESFSTANLYGTGQEISLFKCLRHASPSKLICCNLSFMIQFGDVDWRKKVFLQYTVVFKVWLTAIYTNNQSVLKKLIFILKYVY